MKRSWKLLRLAALSALAFLVLTPGGGLRPADVSADVTNVTIAADSVTSGGNVDIEIEALQNDGPISVVLEGAAGGTTPSFALTACGGCADQGDVGASLSINSADIPISGLITVRLTLTCTTQDNVVVRATQDGVSDTDSLVCNVSTTPTVTPTTTGTPPTSTPTVTTTPGAGDSITLSAVQPNPQCGQAVFLFATVKNAAGGFVAGATVTFSASGGAGSFSPISAVTVTDGVASSTYSPPTTGNQTVTITALSNGKTATATVPVNCSAAATSTPAPVATPVSQVRPPSTGDAGLVDDSNWTVYAGLAALVGTVFMGALVVARRQA